MDITILLKQPEGKTLEFKRDLSSHEGILRTVVAFANTAGGILVVGVEDKTKNIIGVQEPLGIEEKLTNLISDLIEPRLLANIEIKPWRKTYLITVQVYPGSNKPYYFKRHNAQKEAYVRVSSSNRVADKLLIEELKRFSHQESFDEQAYPELNSEAIDFRVASELFAPIKKLKRSDLETLHLITKYQGHKVPTIGGIILFGKERGHYFPDAWIQVGRFDGTNKQHIADTREIKTYPPLAITETMEFVKKHIQISLKINQLQHAEQWSIPQVAIREALINAVVHADYSQRGAPIRLSIFDDRIEIENPGLLPFTLTVDDISQGVSKLRNRVIGRIFHELKYIERWGSGIQRMFASCQESGLQEPKLEEIGTHFRVTIFNTRTYAPQINTLDKSILDLLANGKGYSTQQLAKHIDISARSTRIHLLKLIERGLIVEIGANPTDPKRRYFLANKR